MAQAAPGRGHTEQGDRIRQPALGEQPHQGQHQGRPTGQQAAQPQTVQQDVHGLGVSVGSNEHPFHDGQAVRLRLPQPREGVQRLAVGIRVEHAHRHLAHKRFDGVAAEVVAQRAEVEVPVRLPDHRVGAGVGHLLLGEQIQRAVLGGASPPGDIGAHLGRLLPGRVRLAQGLGQKLRPLAAGDRLDGGRRRTGQSLGALGLGCVGHWPPRASATWTTWLRWVSEYQPQSTSSSASARRGTR